MSRGGTRGQAGRKPSAGERRSEYVPVRITPAERWWWEHMAAQGGMSTSEWVRSLADRAIGEHRCRNCDINTAARILRERAGRADS